MFLRAQDPPMTEAEMARRVNVTRQAFYAWMWNNSIPDPENVVALANELGCTVEELQFDIDASKGWQPPISFSDFLQQAEHAAQLEGWHDKDDILPWLKQLVSWQNVDTFSSNFARDVLIQKIPLHTKAARLARIVRAEKELGNG